VRDNLCAIGGKGELGIGPEKSSDFLRLHLVHVESISTEGWIAHFESGFDLVPGEGLLGDSGYGQKKKQRRNCQGSLGRNHVFHTQPFAPLSARLTQDVKMLTDFRTTRERSGCRRGPALDWGQCGMVEHGGQDAAGSRETQEAEGQFGNGRHEQGRSLRKGRMRRRTCVVTPLAAVGFSWVLECLNVVSHGNDRKQDEQEQGQGNKLRSPMRARVGGAGKPPADREGGEASPCEIEE
jgi:hypothetical protein